jgi:hypothetical protein
MVRSASLSTTVQALLAQRTCPPLLEWVATLTAALRTVLRPFSKEDQLPLAPPRSLRGPDRSNHVSGDHGRLKGGSWACATKPLMVGQRARTKGHFSVRGVSPELTGRLWAPPDQFSGPTFRPLKFRLKRTLFIVLATIEYCWSASSFPIGSEFA